ncbi:DUF4331 family protein [Jeongeupia wiesaeckerbachi]|uniref:DUF4331 family protein n=1 Tax=Jeongeupia wiesaeckerbachi TaxID=3051218 RepID=UPI003D808C40
MNIRTITLTMVTASIMVSVPLATKASHHFESKIAIDHPQFDLTDVYVFESEKKGYTVFSMDVNPRTGSDGKPQFGENGIYSFHIGNDKALSGLGMTFTVQFKEDRAIFGLTKEGANLAVGTIGSAFGEASIGTTKSFSNGVRVWTGSARDQFVGNSAGINKFRNELSAGKVDLTSFKDGVNLFQTLYSSVIVMEVPNKMLPPEIYVYATTALYNVDKWEQVNRMANPLMTHLFMFNNKMEISEHVGHRPDMDIKQRYVVSDYTLRALSLDKESTVKDKVAYADRLAEELLPDVIPYRVGTPASFKIEKINGRKPTDDAMDVQLSRFLGRPVTDYANTFDHHPDTFPYVVSPK